MSITLEYCRCNGGNTKIKSFCFFTTTTGHIKGETYDQQNDRPKATRLGRGDDVKRRAEEFTEDVSREEKVRQVAGS